MNTGGSVTLSADKLLEIADKIKNLESEIRQLGLNGLDITSTPRAPEIQKSKTNAMPLTFDVLSLDWKKSNKAGGGDAGPDAPWAWTRARADKVRAHTVLSGDAPRARFRKYGVNLIARARDLE